MSLTEYYELTKRKGVTLAIAREQMRTRPTLIGAVLLRRGDVDTLLCGTTGVYVEHLRFIADVIGLRPGVKTFAAMNMLMLTDRQVFICDTQVNRNPTAEQLAEITLLAAEEMRRFGLMPRVAMLSHSSFGSSECGEAQIMRDALALVERAAPDLEVEGEMQGDAALSPRLLEGAMFRRAAEGRSEPPGHAQSGCGQYLLQPVEDGGGQRDHGRSDIARRGQAGAHHRAVGERQAHREHDRAGRGGRGVAAHWRIGNSVTICLLTPMMRIE